jgi:branched-chain amino acid transport system ATP-binding protein
MSTPALTLDGVSKRFGGVVAVSDASFKHEGGILGLIGPNGAGKSTLVGLISGFRRPDSGRISFGEHDLTRLDPSEIARTGVVRTFQQAAPLKGLTVLENVLVGMHTRHRATLGSILLRTRSMRNEAAAAVEEANALLKTFGLDADANVQAESLTFGKLRFLEIARALAMHPKLLLLDEPAAGLNEEEPRRLGDTLRRVNADGVGILLIDHDVPFVFGLCDQVVVLNFGSVLATGTPDEMFADPRVREAYLGEAAATTDAESF